ncbi:MAG: hypothetical protein B6D64_06235 [Bacteroidetes bacterium 4484_276]|nr:MAG: hypothetical protein B6D64_06235 [Bacteroidetes bacterium 4484_276]
MVNLIPINKIVARTFSPKGIFKQLCNDFGPIITVGAIVFTSLAENHATAGSTVRESISVFSK